MDKNGKVPKAGGVQPGGKMLLSGLRLRHHQEEWPLAMAPVFRRYDFFGSSFRQHGTTNLHTLANCVQQSPLPILDSCPSGFPDDLVVVGIHEYNASAFIALEPNATIYDRYCALRRRQRIGNRYVRWSGSHHPHLILWTCAIVTTARGNNQAAGHNHVDKSCAGCAHGVTRM